MAIKTVLGLFLAFLWAIPVWGQVGGRSLTAETAVISLFDGSAESQIASTNLGASKALSLSRPGTLTQLCIISSLGSVIAEDGSIFFFKSDPEITVDTSDMTIAEAQTVVAVVSFRGADYRTNFATSAVNCQDINESFEIITHVVYHQEGSTTLDDEDIEMRLAYIPD